MKYLMLILIISQVANATDFPVRSPASTDPDNVYLKSGAPAPFDLIGFPLPRAERVRLMEIDFSTCTKRLDLSTQDNALYQQRVDNFSKENTRLSELNAKNNSFLSEFGMYFLGVASTIAVAFAVSHVTR